MKRRVALGALVVLAGVVSLGALLMWGPVGSTPEASATHWYDLLAGRDEANVGAVEVGNDTTDLYVAFSAESPWCLTEVHVCVSEQSFEWVAPGSEKKCEDEGGVHRGFEFDMCMEDYTVTIPLADIGALPGSCPLYIQAHAVVMNPCTGEEETAYGDEFKASFEHLLCHCPAP
jgi:hypothetical protein